MSYKGGNIFIHADKQVASEPPFLLAKFTDAMSTLVNKIDAIIRPSLAAKGIDIVQIKLVEGAKRKTIQILAENTATGRITLDECALASRTISALLDVEDVVPGAYNLEVSSPGIDRPLVNMADFAKYLGFEARIETSLPIAGRGKFRGMLRQAEGDTITIEVDGAEHSIALGNVAQAKLVLSDALIKAYQKGGVFAPKDEPKPEIEA